MHKSFLTSFSYKGIAKKCTSFSNEFLLQACGQTDIRTAVHTDRRTYIYPPLDKRYSPIISSICGPNKCPAPIIAKKKICFLCHQDGTSSVWNSYNDQAYHLPRGWHPS